MKIEDIIEGLNRHIDSQRSALGITETGHIVLHKEVLSNSSFKIYKTFKYNLWFIKNKKSYKVLTLSETIKVPTGQEEQVEKELSISLSTLIFNWIGSDSYTAIIKGEYDGTESRNE